MISPASVGAPIATPPPPPRLLKARRRLRAGLLQLLSAAVGLALGLTLPQLSVGPTVEGSQLPALLFSLGVGVIGVVTIVFSLLFGVVQWSASSFTPRLTLFRDSPLVWGTFAFTIGVFVYSVSAGLASGNTGRVSLVVPITAVVAVLAVFALIRALQTRAFLSLQLAHVLASVAARGQTVIGDLYASPSLRLMASHRPRRLLFRRHCVRSAGSDRRPWCSSSTCEGSLTRLPTATPWSCFASEWATRCTRGRPWPTSTGATYPIRRCRGAVVRGAERSFDQDPMLAMRLLADIALRALSAAVNDPATAVDAVDATEGLLRALAVRELHVADVADSAGAPRVRLVVPTWEDYLRTGVEDLLPSAAPVPMVLERLKKLLNNIVEISPPSRHGPLIRLSEQVQNKLVACRPPGSHL